MIALQTKVKVPESTFKIDFTKNILFNGSCFTENIGARLQQSAFNTCINPFGVNYNPQTVLQTLNRLLHNNLITANELKQHNGRFFSFTHNTKFSDVDRETCLKKINRSITNGHNFLAKTNTVFLSFGTAWVYELLPHRNVVANCHKLPSANFNRKMLTIESIVTDYSMLIENLKAHNPAVNIVFTVSPVRHWKDGAIENQRSKATLILAIQQIIKIFPDTLYFPAYEIMMDELRDYRFYADDLLHPSKMAIDILWEYFQQAFFSESTRMLVQKISKYNAAISHKNQTQNAESIVKHQQYLKSLKTEIKTKIPGIQLA